MMTVPLFILYIFSAFILFVAVVLYVRTFDGLSCEGLSVLDGTVAYWLAVVIWTGFLAIAGLETPCLLFILCSAVVYCILLVLPSFLHHKKKDAGRQAGTSGALCNTADIQPINKITENMNKTFESKEMWLVEYDLSLHQVCAFTDPETEEVVVYKYVNDKNRDEGFYGPESHERLFPGREQAEKFIAERMDYLKTEGGEVSEYLDLLSILPEDRRPVDLQKLLPSEYRQSTKALSDRVDKLRMTVRLLHDYVRHGVLNIGPYTFLRNQVVRVIWRQEYKATLILSDGSTVTTSTDVEFDIVESVFGSNKSGRVLSGHSSDRT